jgi:hypothetical protein
MCEHVVQGELHRGRRRPRWRQAGGPRARPHSAVRRYFDPTGLRRVRAWREQARRPQANRRADLLAWRRSCSLPPHPLLEVRGQSAIRQGCLRRSRRPNLPPAGDSRCVDKVALCGAEDCPGQASTIAATAGFADRCARATPTVPRAASPAAPVPLAKRFGPQSVAILSGRVSTSTRFGRRRPAGSGQGAARARKWARRLTPRPGGHTLSPGRSAHGRRETLR